MRAALNRGVKGVVWVNLKACGRPPRLLERSTESSAVKEALARLHLANWNSVLAGPPGWFFDANDGIHLTGAGAVGLVKLVRKYIPRAARAAARAPPRR